MVGQSSVFLVLAGRLLLAQEELILNFRRSFLRSQEESAEIVGQRFRWEGGGCKKACLMDKESSLAASPQLLKSTPSFAFCLLWEFPHSTLRASHYWLYVDQLHPSWHWQMDRPSLDQGSVGQPSLEACLWLHQAKRPTGRSTWGYTQQPPSGMHSALSRPQILLTWIFNFCISTRFGSVYDWKRCEWMSCC